MAKIKKNTIDENNDEQLSLNDDRRVKVLSPGTLVAKRFFRNRLAVVGLSMLIIMFIFSFVGGYIIPYEEDEVFKTYEDMNQEYAGVVNNESFRYITPDGGELDSVIKGYMELSIDEQLKAYSKGTINKNNVKGELPNGAPILEFHFKHPVKDVYYLVTTIGIDSYTVSLDSQILAVSSKNVIYDIDTAESALTFEERLEIIKQYTNYYEEPVTSEPSEENASEENGSEDEEQTITDTQVTTVCSFDINGKAFEILSDGNIMIEGENVAYLSKFIVSAKENGTVITRQFQNELENVLIPDANLKQEFIYTDENGEDHAFTAKYSADSKNWIIYNSQSTKVIDRYREPSSSNWLGTDGNGMDVLTRLMYGGRVSLVIGFIVVFIAAFIGVILGGVSGYFGGWVDNLIMRIVDVFYCIPSTPLIIILGAAMDAMMVKNNLRMLYLMLILGFLGWPGIARLVRGQILSLREQEFMTATESCGISVSRRIFKHLIPNVIPQLIVTCTMSLGSTILTEATLSFLGLGVKFPYASWGNIINDVNNTFVLQNYWFIWIPAGVCLLITVLGFNFVGDGLRDAFDPKMKR